MDSEIEVARLAGPKALGKEVAESVLLLTIAVLTLGGYVGVVMALLQVAR